MQAVTTGAYRAVEFIKANIKLEGIEKASVADSKTALPNITMNNVANLCCISASVCGQMLFASFCSLAPIQTTRLHWNSPL